MFLKCKDIRSTDEVWDTIRISGGSEGIIQKVAKNMLQNEAIISLWAPALLLMELDNLLWKDNANIQIKKLWEYLCTYCYLPRLANETVLHTAIQKGLNSTEYFAFASGFDGTRYIDLKFNQFIGIIEQSGYLVKVDATQKQLADDEAKRQAAIAQRAQLTGGSAVTEDTSNSGAAPSAPDTIGDAGTQPSIEAAQIAQPKNTHFYMSASLDTTRIGRDVQRLVEEVISHLTSTEGAEVEISLELNVKAPAGLPQQIVRTVSVNYRTLRVESFGFEE